MTSTRLKKLELCCGVSRKEIFVQNTPMEHGNPVMASNRSQITVSEATDML